MVWQVKTKWGAAKKQIVGDIKYDSHFEAGYARDLILEKAAGKIKDFKAHQPIELIHNGYLICKYYIDFVVYHLDGTIEYVETKGYQHDVWKLKWKMFCAEYEDKPNVKITLVQQGNYFKRPKIKKLR